MAILRDRLYNAQYPSHGTSSITPPTFPFPRVDVKAAPAVEPQVRMITSVTELYAAIIRPSTPHLLSRDYSSHYGPMTLMRKEFVNAVSKVTGFLRLLRFIPQEMLLGWVEISS